ncbi:MAG: hypothetical protein EBZ17_13915 [Actinobacteria bacterium]|nr:hypothetical protein [Actinomycetota bacterium]
MSLMAAVVAPRLGDVQGLDPRNEGRQFTAVEEKATTRISPMSLTSATVTSRPSRAKCSESLEPPPAMSRRDPDESSHGRTRSTSAEP